MGAVSALDSYRAWFWYVSQKYDEALRQAHIAKLMTRIYPSYAVSTHVPSAFSPTQNGSLLLLTLVTGADVNSSFTLGHSLSCFLVMVWSRKFAGTRVSEEHMMGGCFVVPCPRRPLALVFLG